MTPIRLFECRKVEVGTIELPTVKADCFDQATAILHHLTDDSPVELFVVIALNGRNDVIGVEIIGKGGLHGCALKAIDVFRSVIVAGGCACIVGHNHPSGDSTPSVEDFAFMRSLSAASDAIGLPIVDSIIVEAGGG